MRMIIGTLALTAMVGCSGPDEVALEHRSSQEVQARGLAFDEAGSIANVGMVNTTCNVNTQMGTVEADYDYGNSAETVTDGGELFSLGQVNIVLTPDEVHVTTPDIAPYQASYPQAGVVDAGLTGDGFVAVADDGSVSWSAFDGTPVQDVTTGLSTASGADLVADRSTGNVFLSADQGVFAVGRDGATFEVRSEPGLVAWDASADALYVATPGTSTLEAYEADGTLRWAVDLDGTIQALTHMGSTGRAALSLDTSAGGEFVVVDGATGMVTSDIATPSAAQRLHVSGNGHVLAVTLPSAVHFFDITAQ
ncbi:MAG: hypothetical protein KC656_00750 [Myxococcales bacterium]|nr:hypothetical protein [Myxococcales bacterium]MCB9672887.1 hypothetical protein [Alphaproteobacteria bacterium]